MIYVSNQGTERSDSHPDYYKVAFYNCCVSCRYSDWSLQCLVQLIQYPVRIGRVEVKLVKIAIRIQSQQFLSHAYHFHEFIPATSDC